MNAVPYTHRYPSWDRFRPMLLKVSLAISILFCFFVMNVETVASKIKADIFYEPEEKIFTMPTPPTIHKKKEIPPPKEPEPIKPKEKIPTVIETADQIEKSPVEDKLFVDPEVDGESKGPVEVPVTAPAPKIEIPKEPIIEDKVWNRVEQMPIFGECSLDDFEGEELTKCSNTALLLYIHENLKYPAFARKNGIEGTAVIQFVVDKTGTVTSVTIARDLAGGCGKAAKKVMESLPKWKPGKQNGRPVKVLYTVPVKFKLN